MNPRIHTFALAALAAIVAAGCGRPPAPTPAGFTRAVSPRAWSFPADHGSHPEYRTEWWYVTGHLQDESGRPFAYQLTFFRSAKPISAEQSPTGRPALAQVVHYHGAWADVQSQLFLYDEARGVDLQRTGSADSGRLALKVKGYELTDWADGTWRARFDVQGLQIDLEYRIPSEPLLHGAQPGLTIKGREPGEASQYYSLTRIPTTGSVREPGGGPARRLQGQSWFDHEFGTEQQGEGQVGWDWFSTSLADGTDLMLYVLRRRDGSPDPVSSGTLRLPDGRVEHLTRDQFSVEATTHWTSPHTGATYPAAWRLRVPAHQLELEGVPLLPDQELQTPQTVQVTYWEGAARFQGTRAGQPVEGRGYVELVGYAKPFEKVF